MISFHFSHRYLHSTTVSCLATQLFGAPTLLEDSQRYIPVSSLDTLLNFCSKPSEKNSQIRRGKVSSFDSVHCTKNAAMFVCAHHRALVCVNAVRSISCGRQSLVVFVPAVGGWRHAELVLTEQFKTGADKYRVRNLARWDMRRHCGGADEEGQNMHKK